MIGHSSAACSRRSSPGAASSAVIGGDRPGAVPRRAAAAVLGAQVGVAGAAATRPTGNRAVPLTYEQFRFAFANAVSEDEASELYETFAVPASGAPLFQAADREPQPVDRGQGRHQEPRPRARC